MAEMSRIIPVLRAVSLAAILVSPATLVSVASAAPKAHRGAHAKAAGREQTKAAPKVYSIVIQNLAFGPAPSGLHPVDVVEWTNKDILRHTATAKDKSFDLDLAPGKTGRAVVKTAGVIDYFCRFHPGMTGRLTVAK